jgi:hypothetical protein
MGLTFHYNGRIAKQELLPELIEEVKDIAEIHKWKYHIFERQFPDKSFGISDYNQNIYGIYFTPPGCETVSLSFLSNGRMCDAPHLKFFGKTETNPEHKYLYMLSVKTQYAGAEIHKFIIQLFRYLDKKYLADLELFDDCGYWETNDEEILRSNFKRNADLIESFASALEYYPSKPGENIELYLEKILKQINDKKIETNDNILKNKIFKK